MTARHFPPPWSVEDQGSCFSSAITTAVYYDHPQAGDLTWDEARRIAIGLC
jgi:hypothetical protein